MNFKKSKDILYHSVRHAYIMIKRMLSSSDRWGNNLWVWPFGRTGSDLLPTALLWVCA